MLAILRRWPAEPQNPATGGRNHASDGARAAEYVNTFTAAAAAAPGAIICASIFLQNAGVAQLVEQLIRNQ
jgi:hypothetical protein